MSKFGLDGFAKAGVPGAESGIEDALVEYAVGAGGGEVGGAGLRLVGTGGGAVGMGEGVEHAGVAVGV